MADYRRLLVGIVDEISYHLPQISGRPHRRRVKPHFWMHLVCKGLSSFATDWALGIWRQKRGERPKNFRTARWNEECRSVSDGRGKRGRRVLEYEAGRSFMWYRILQVESP